MSETRGSEDGNIRDRIERGFAAWGHLAYRRAWWVIALVLALTGAAASRLPDLWIDTSTEGFFHEDEPARKAYDRFREQFGRDTMILVALGPPEVFDLGFLERLRALHEDVEENVPRLVEVTSLINARETRGEGDELIVGDFLDTWPETPLQLADLERRALANPFYVNNVVSRRGDFTALVIETEAYSTVGVAVDEFGGFDEGADEGVAGAEPEFLSGEENTEIVEALEEVLERHRAPDFPIWVSGTPVLTHELQKNMQRDQARFTVLAVVVIVIFLSLLFRRLSGVVLPLVTVILSVTCTISLMAATNTPLMLPTQILPSFLLAVGVGGAVHILAIFYQALRRGDDKEAAIAFAMGHSGLAVFMTGLTTAGGLLSFAAAELVPISHFGVFGPAGVMIAQLFSLTLLPALIAVFPVRVTPGKRETFVSQRALVRLGDFCVRHARPVAGVWGVAILIALAGAAQLRFTHHPFEWFAEGSSPRVASEQVNQSMEGSLFLEFLIHTNRENGLHDPELLARLDAIDEMATRARHGEASVGQTQSLAGVVKEIHQALNENRPEFYALPSDRQLVSQELLLFENSGSDDLENFVDSEFSTGRMTMKLPFIDAVYLPGLYNVLQQGVGEILGDSAEFEITGMGFLMGETILAVMHTMARSYVMALIIITPLMVLLIGRVRLGLVAMIPNLAPILITLGAMGWLGVGIDTFTLLIGCIAIGLAVDDTIHFMHNFRRYYDQTGEVPEAVRRTLATTGQAMLVTSCVLSAGFFIYMGSAMPTLFRFGLLTGSTIILAFLADVVFAPALMALVMRPREQEATAPATPMEVIR